MNFSAVYSALVLSKLNCVEGAWVKHSYFVMISTNVLVEISQQRNNEKIKRNLKMSY